MLARAFSKPSLARSARFFLASCWLASATTFFIVSWSISACRRTRRCQPSKAILFALVRASMFFRSRSTSAAKSTPGRRNWLMSLVKSKTGVSPTAAFSIDLMSLDLMVFSVGLLSSDTALFSAGLLSLDTTAVSVGLLSSGAAVFTAGLLSSETVPFFISLLSLDTVAFFFVGLLFLDMMFSRGLVECLSRVSRGKPLRVDTDQRVSHRLPQHTGAQRAPFFEEIKRWETLEWVGSQPSSSAASQAGWQSNS